MPSILVSACLLGIPCRYDGRANADIRSRLHDLGFTDEEIVPVCPEGMGGLPTPRIPSEITTKTPLCVLASDGRNVTRNFQDGAAEALRQAQNKRAAIAVLKEKSPSCGTRLVYDGTFSRTLIEGRGVAAELLSKAGLKIISSDDIMNLEPSDLR